jgi:hypothetical protein
MRTGAAGQGRAVPWRHAVRLASGVQETVGRIAESSLRGPVGAVAGGSGAQAQQLVSCSWGAGWRWSQPLAARTQSPLSQHSQAALATGTGATPTRV